MNKNKKFKCPNCQVINYFPLDPRKPGVFGICRECKQQFINHTKLLKKQRFYNYFNEVKEPVLLCSCTFEPQKPNYLELPANYFKLSVVIATINGIYFKFRCYSCENTFQVMMEKY